MKGLFSKDEMERRMAGLRSYMEQNQLEGVLLTSMHNINYYADFLYCSFGRHYGLVVTPGKCVLLSANIDGGQPWRRIPQHFDNVAYTDWQKDNFFFLVKQQLGEISGKIGLEMDHMTVDSLKKINEALPAQEKVDVAEGTMHLKTVKSHEEHEVIRQGARIADVGGAAAVETIHEGAGEHEVALASVNAMVREIAKTFPPTEIRDTWSWFQSGINTDGAHNPVTTRKLQPGDCCSLNCFPMIQGYYTALERTVFLHSCTDEQLKMWEKNNAVFQRGIELIRPGAKCSDIAKELNEMYKKDNLLQYRRFGYGHSFGVLCQHYGREAALEIRETVDTIIQPGNVLSMEPMIYIPDGKPGAGAYREHDMVIVHERGIENITKFPWGPEKLIIKK